MSVAYAFHSLLAALIEPPFVSICSLCEGSSQSIRKSRPNRPLAKLSIGWSS